MGARLRVFLTRKQDIKPENCGCATESQRPSRGRLNAHGWYVEKIAAHFNWTPNSKGSFA